MSRATIIFGLSRVLGRHPTRQEYEAMCEELGPGCVMYVPLTWPVMAEADPEIRRLRGEGKSVRKIARELKVSKSAVHRVLSQNCLCLVDAETV